MGTSRRRERVSNRFIGSKTNTMSPYCVWSVFLCVYTCFFSIFLYLDYKGPLEHFHNTKYGRGRSEDDFERFLKGFRANDIDVIKKAVYKYNINPYFIQAKNEIPEMLRYVMKEDLEIPLLTLFTTWASSEEKYECHNNTVHNWMSLYPIVQPIVFTDEKQIMKEVRKKGWIALPVRKAGRINKLPVLKEMFKDAMMNVNSVFYSYSNSDILFTGNLIHTLFKIISYHLTMRNVLLIIGQRTNVFHISREEAKTWKTILKAAEDRGDLYDTWAIDYFISTRNYPWSNIPEVVVGRPAFDNFVVWYTKKQNFTTIDATLTILAVHQTTMSGNLEGHNHTDRLYNRKVISRQYRRVRWGTGTTACASNITMYSQQHGIKIIKRPLNKNCKA